MLCEAFGGEKKISENCLLIESPLAGLTLIYEREQMMHTIAHALKFDLSQSIQHVDERDDIFLLQFFGELIEVGYQIAVGDLGCVHHIVERNDVLVLHDSSALEQRFELGKLQIFRVDLLEVAVLVAGVHDHCIVGAQMQSIRSVARSTEVAYQPQ